SSSWGRRFISGVLRVPVRSKGTGHSLVVGYPFLRGGIALVQERLTVTLGSMFRFRPGVAERRSVRRDQIHTVGVVLHCPLTVRTRDRPARPSANGRSVVGRTLVGVGDQLTEQIRDRLATMRAGLIGPRGSPPRTRL